MISTIWAFQNLTSRFFLLSFLQKLKEDQKVLSEIKAQKLFSNPSIIKRIKTI